MTIAQRLRLVADLTRTEEVHIKALLREAADELDRRQFRLQDLMEAREVGIARIDSLTAERDRVLGWNKALTGRDADKEVHDLSMQLTMERSRLAAADDALLQSHKRERELEARLAAAEEGWRKAAQGEKE